MSMLRKILLVGWIVAGAVAITAALARNFGFVALWLDTVLVVAMATFTMAGLAWLVIVVAQHRSHYETQPPP